jgi:serine/threonine protein kinase
MRGTLTAQSLAHAMREIAARRVQGILHVTRDGVSKRIYFSDGKIVFAGTDDGEERLGAMLVRGGKLRPTDLDLALKRMVETGETLGKTLADMGMTSPEDVARYALQRTKEIVRSLFAWTHGEFFFEQREISIRDGTALSLSVTDMILDGIRRIDDLEVVRTVLGDRKAVLRQPARSSHHHVEDGSMSASVEWLLYQANGVATIEDVVAGSPLDEDKTLRSIFALVAAGVLDLETAGEQEERPHTTISLGTTGTTSDTVELDFSGLELPDPAEAGKKFGRYEVHHVLGRGSMGAVCLATDPAIDRPVAIKLVRTAVQLTAPELEKYRERFQREAKAAGSLSHPGIVTVFDVGHTEEQTPFIVMEYVQGRTLQEILRPGPLPIAETVRLADGILDALGYAHRQGIVHRDIKPANIIVTDEDVPKIMDFGIAHVVGSEMTQADEVLGSPHYMAPEQLSKGRIDQRTDLFALGVVLYKMLTGKLPFTGDSIAAIAKAILFDDPVLPTELDPAIPPALSAAILRCLSRDPEARFADASELKRALFDAAQGPPEEREREVPGEEGSIGHFPQAKRRRRPRFVAPLSVAALVVAIVSVVLVMEVPKQSQPITVGGAASPSPALAGISDAELYHRASVALDSGDLAVARAVLVNLLGRNPGFEGAPELLVRVNERLRRESAANGDPSAGPMMNGPQGELDARLFYQAGLAFERGEWQQSKTDLETLLTKTPSFAGAIELLARVNDEMWKERLPLSFRARHNHRIGNCNGTLTLEKWGIGFSSDDHQWLWKFGEIRMLERESRTVLNVETFETDVLGLGKPKNYRFELATPIRDEDWSRFERLRP